MNYQLQTAATRTATVGIPWFGIPEQDHGRFCFVTNYKPNTNGRD